MLSFGYADVGPIRRGLGGTVEAALISADPMISSAASSPRLTQCALALLCAVTAIRSGRIGRDLAVLGVILLAVFLRMADDVGRVDGMILLIGSLSTLAAKAGRWIVACALLALALAIHETGLILLAPLLAAYGLSEGRWRTVSLTQGVVGAAVLAAAAIAYLALGGANEPGAAVAHLVLSRLPSAPDTEPAAYVISTGSRGVLAAICQNIELAQRPMRSTSGLAWPL